MDWKIVLNPDCDWAVTEAGKHEYATREAAIAAIIADPLCGPDTYGNRSGAAPIPVEIDGCACYGRHCCAACVMAYQAGLEAVEQNRRSL